MAWNGRARLGLRGARGATGVEYALVLGLFVISSIGAIQFFEDETAAEVDIQADCISTRPPPSSCQPAAATPLGGGGGGVGGDPGGGDPAPTETASFQPTTVTVTRADDPIFEVETELTIFDSASQPLPDELITGQVRITQSSVPGRVGQSFYVTCVTDETGTCTMAFDSRFDDVTQIEFAVIAVGADTTYDFGSFGLITIDQPLPNTTVTGTG